ncbi:Flagellar hook-associated protein FlgK [hydrothermal vent metagenome]|uniref:Flagellar hook-associated protein FlgK n=1 Tax=hydrothermal vent metagenome TaxID=652676 RepID=A0A3B0WPW1_9ZZZZ
MAGSSLLSIGSSGLQAFQRSLNTIGNNIANVNTDGYSRQNVELSSRIPQPTGYGFAGAGVQTVSVTRAYDAFIEGSVRSTTSSVKEFEIFQTLSAQLDNVLADPDAGVANSMQSFFNAVQDTADSPSSPAIREVLLKQGQNLSEQFNELAAWMNNVRGQLNSNLRGSVSEINRLSGAIAKLNESIVVQEGRSGGQPANGLLDQRDVLIRDLSELVSVTTVQQDDSSVNVMAGTGQVLVVGNKPSTLEVFIEASDPNQLGIAIRGNSNVLVPITEQLSGGNVGGLLSFRDRMLDPASNSLGLTAIGLSNYINEQQNRGMDLDGALGQNFFNVSTPQALTLAGTPANVTVAFDDISQLTNKDYNLRYNAGVWQLTQNDTNQVVTMTGTGTAADPFIADGFSLEIGVAPTNGDAYIIRPTRNGATDIQMTLVNNRQIAAAAPMRSLAAATNTGTGEISAGLVTDINNAAFQTTAGQLTPPVLVRFSNGNSYDVFDNTNPVSPVLLEAGIAYNPATGGEIFPTPGGLDYGYSVQINGAPVAGDEFSTEYNAGGIGDNRNALLLAGVASNKVMASGTASITNSYSALVADVGSGTKQAELNTLAQRRVLDQAISNRESISGVNLDEEAANLLRFQQAYQAAAQVITVANSLFDTLLNAVRR